MKKILRIFKTHWFFIIILLTITSSIILRTYNIQDRPAYGSDNIRDVIIAQEALKRGEIPLIGSFSSAGPFVFGPLFYWFNMFALFLMPFSYKTPWILMNIVGTLTVLIMIKIGYLLGGKRLAIITGLLTAFCPQFISRSNGLSQHSLVGITSALLILFFVLLYKRKKIIYSLLMGLSIGTALSMHYQAINLLIFFPAIFLIPKISLKKKILAAFIFFIGAFIPTLPLIYWDYYQNFSNTRNILDYIFIGQYRIYVPNSWRLYTLGFLPDYWSNVVGGNKPVAFIIMVSFLLSLLYALIKRGIKGYTIVLFLIFGILLVVIRYYRGERFDGYMIYIAPFIFIASAWTLLFLFDSINISLKKRYITQKYHKYFTYLSIFILLIILAFDFKNASQFIFVKNTHYNNVLMARDFLVKKIPNTKFHLYDYMWQSSDYTYLLSQELSDMGLIDNNGYKIGVTLKDDIYPHFLLYKSDSIKLVSLENVSKNSIKKPTWSQSNPSEIYDDLMKWQKSEKLKSTFYLDKFIKEKLKIY